MNQHRWTCLTTFILTAVIAPIATVRAAVPAPSATTGAESSPLSPQLLPTITPLTVTAVETEAVIPTVNQPVPLVSKLPIVVPLSSQTTQHHSSQHQKIARVGKPPAKQPVAIQPHSIFDPKANAPVFNPNNFLANAPIVVTSEPTAAPVAAVVPVHSLTGRSLPAPAVASQTESTPILVVHRDRAQTTIIPNSTTAQAEIDAPSVPTDLAATAITSGTAKLNDIPIPQPEVVPVPQVAPIVAGANNRSDTPSFEAGLPVFIFERERSSHRQIVATAIAQIGDDIVAPEPSIAIPVEPPKQQKCACAGTSSGGASDPTRTDSKRHHQSIDQSQPTSIQQDCRHPHRTGFLVWI